MLLGDHGFTAAIFYWQVSLFVSRAWLMPFRDRLMIIPGYGKRGPVVSRDRRHRQLDNDIEIR